MAEQTQRPLPAVDDLTRPFWEAAKQHKLAIQRCQDCGYYNHPPKPTCDACLSQQLIFEPVSGQGTVFSFAVMHQPNIAGFEGQIPYINLMVELNEQPMLLLVSHLSGSERSNVHIGRRVEVYFEDVSEEISLPMFRVV